MATTLVPGRECGTCTACCVELTIDVPELRKPAGHPCPNCIVEQGCTVYHQRPVLCRTWHCAWRRLDWIGESLRPDRSGVLICPTDEDLPAGYDPRFGLDVALLRRAGLRAPGLAEMLGHAIRANIATFLCLPGGAGQGGARALLNEALLASAARGQTAVLLHHLDGLYLQLSVLGEAYMRQPIMLPGGAPSDAGGRCAPGDASG